MIDYIEDLPKDDLDCRHIAVVVDCFSRYCTLHAMKTTKASELARSLLSHVSIFGVPDDLITDKGPAFTSDVFKDLMLLLGTAHQKTLTGSKEEAGIVERLNKKSCVIYATSSLTEEYTILGVRTSRLSKG